MSPRDLTSEVTAIVAEIAEVDPGRITPSAALADLGVDSIDGLRIVAAVERKYGIVIDEAEIGKIRTMPDILKLIDRYESQAR